MGEKSYFSGTTPGAGKYKCKQCDYEIELADGEELPICPWCCFDQYWKIG